MKYRVLFEYPKGTWFKEFRSLFKATLYFNKYKSAFKNHIKLQKIK